VRLPPHAQSGASARQIRMIDLFSDRPGLDFQLAKHAPDAAPGDAAPLRTGAPPGVSCPAPRLEESCFEPAFSSRGRTGRGGAANVAFSQLVVAIARRTS